VEFTENDRKWMRLALEEARLALDIGEVPVGCVIVHRGQTMIGRGSNRTNASRNGTRHAEFEAIDQIISASGTPYTAEVFIHCALYVTCEPCIMCAAALRILCIGKVYYGCKNDRFGGNGSIVKANTDCHPPSLPTYISVGSLYEQEAIQLFRDFYIRGNDHAPVPHRRPRPAVQTAVQESDSKDGAKDVDEGGPQP